MEKDVSEVVIVPACHEAPEGDMITTDRKTWIPAPHSSSGVVSTGDVIGVYLAADEEVEWIFNYNRVVGYTIKTKK